MERVCWSKFMRDLEPSLPSRTTFYFLSDNQSVALGKLTWQRWIRWDLGKLGVSLQVIGWDSVYQDCSYCVGSVSGRKGWRERFRRCHLRTSGVGYVDQGRGGWAGVEPLQLDHVLDPVTVLLPLLWAYFKWRSASDVEFSTGSCSRWDRPGCWPVVSLTMENFINAPACVSMGRMHHCSVGIVAV